MTNHTTTTRIHAHDISTGMSPEATDAAIDAQLATQAGGVGRVASNSAEPEPKHYSTDAAETAEAGDDAAPLEIGADLLDLAKHDCTLTVTNPATGGHRTFRIRTVHNAKKEYMQGKRLVELLTGPDNGSDYLAFAFMGTDVDFEPGKVRVWRKFQGTAACKSEYERFADLLNRPDYWAGRGVQFLASLRCRRCGRKLTHPDSIRDGLGPICRDKM